MFAVSVSDMVLLFVVTDKPFAFVSAVTATEAVAPERVKLPSASVVVTVPLSTVRLESVEVTAPLDTAKVAPLTTGPFEPSVNAVPVPESVTEAVNLLRLDTLKQGWKSPRMIIM